MDMRIKQVRCQKPPFPLLAARDDKSSLTDQPRNIKKMLKMIGYVVLLTVFWAIFFFLLGITTTLLGDAAVVFALLWVVSFAFDVLSTWRCYLKYPALFLEKEHDPFFKFYLQKTSSFGLAVILEFLTEAALVVPLGAIFLPFFILVGSAHLMATTNNFFALRWMKGHS
jgi:hypothetical protein